MKILQEEGKVTIMAATPNALQLIERAGRTAYQSYRENPITDESAENFIRMILNRGHESVIEHASMTALFELNSRGQTHEQVRHRLCAFTQESTRYVDESEVRFVAPPGKDYWDDVEIGTKGAVQACPSTDGMQALLDFTLNMPDDGAVALLDKDGKVVRDIEAGVFREAFDGFCRPERVVLPLWSKVFIDEQFYRALRTQLKWKYQDARQHLPIGLVAEIVHTANFREWRHIFRLRCAKGAHWEIRRIMRILLAECYFLWPVLFDDLVELLGKEGESRLQELRDEQTKFGQTKIGRFR
jgi:thymidylate synthase (FAD)